MVVGEQFTPEKYNVGVLKENLFKLLMSINKVNLKNLNEENIYSSVDFQIADTNIYIELKHRRIKSNSYQALMFDKKGGYLERLTHVIRCHYLYCSFF